MVNQSKRQPTWPLLWPTWRVLAILWERIWLLLPTIGDVLVILLDGMLSSRLLSRKCILTMEILQSTPFAIACTSKSRVVQAQRLIEKSRGNLEFTSFMETVDQAWKDQYIGGFISAAAPWSGSSDVSNISYNCNK